MKPSAMIFATVLASALSTSAMAQAPQGGGAGQTPSGQTAAANPVNHDKEMTIAGCLEKNKSGGFWLTKAMPASGTSTTGAVGTSGTAAPGRNSGAGMVYNLEDANGKVGTADLDKHVGQKIEVTGRVDDSKSGDKLKSPSPSGATSTDREIDAQDFHISSFKMLASSCS